MCLLLLKEVLTDVVNTGVSTDESVKAFHTQAVTTWQYRPLQDKQAMYSGETDSTGTINVGSHTLVHTG